MRLRNELNIDHSDIQKMVFIYNALNDGWSVRKIDKDKFELTKDNEKIKKEIILDECIKKYVKYNISNSSRI